MSRHQKTKNRTLLMFFALGVWGVSTLSYAAPASPTVSNTSVCAVLEDFSGHVEILNEDRTRMSDPDVKSPINCGSWLAVEVGWAKIRHRDGHRIQIGQHAFVQFPENNADGHFSGDHVVVYRGQVYGETGAGANELKMITTNARARIGVGSGVVIFNEKDEESQFLALENKGEFENRFTPEKRVTVRSGEASTLNFKLLRVVPSDPRAISVSHLRPILSDLHLSQRDQDYAVKNTHKRLNRQFASIFKAGTDEGATDAAIAQAEMEKKQKEKIQKDKAKHTYMRHRPSKKDAELQQHWMSKVVGGDPQSESIIMPEGRKSRKPAGQLAVEGEKQRLMDELSRVKEEE